MKAIPNYQAEDRVGNQSQNTQNKAYGDIAKGPLTNGSILTEISLKSGSNDVSHKLGRKLQGWFIVRQRASATIYDSQDTNKTQDLTLSLNSSASVSVDIYVF